MRRITASAFAALLIAAVPAVAHHSFAMFDMQKTVKFNATVTEFKWTNPHSFMHIDVAAAGGTTESWTIEMTSPNNLINAGWRRSSLKTGDKVVVEVHPLRNGRKGGALMQVTLPNGQTLKNS